MNSIKIDHFVLVVLLMGVLSAEHHAGLDTHEDRNTNDHANDEVSTNFLGGAHVVALILGQKIELLLISRLASEWR